MNLLGSFLEGYGIGTIIKQLFGNNNSNNNNEVDDKFYIDCFNCGTSIWVPLNQRENFTCPHCNMNLRCVSTKDKLLRLLK
jgi:predicted RNA-binding Zn-ribbon protein involved in translation (DUF1610 family)